MSAIFKRMLFCTLFLYPGRTIAASGQLIDPFYLNMLKDGKRAFQARDYYEAAKTLEVAVFGLHGDKKLAAEAYVYLSLSYANRGEKAEARQAFSAASQAVGETAFEPLGLPETILKDLEAAFGPFPLRKDGENPDQRPPEEASVSLPAESAQKEKIRPTNPENGERRAGLKGDNIPLFYEMYDAHRQRGDIKAAKSILLALLRLNPAEPDANYLLARIELVQNNHKKALEHFNQGLSPAAGKRISPEYALPAKIGMAWCLFRLDRKKDAALLLKSIQQEYPETEIAAKLEEERLEGSWRLMQNQLADLL